MGTANLWVNGVDEKSLIAGDGIDAWVKYSLSLSVSMTSSSFQGGVAEKLKSWKVSSIYTEIKVATVVMIGHN